MLRIPLDDAKRAAKELDGTVNDVMLTALAEGAARYHEVRNTPISELRATFVVSTRTDHDVGGNAFTPTKIRLPGSDMATAERFAVIHDRATARRSEVGGQGSLSTIAGVANLFPTSVITRLARSQAAGIDFATSNLRAAPFTVFVGGAEVEALYPMGPVAGTAFNATMISYDGYLHLGLMCDPAAIEDPGALRDDVAAGWEQVVEAGANR